MSEPTPKARVEDLLIRFGALARELAPQLPAPAAAPLLQELSLLLQELPAVDATSHRYTLLRDLRVRMQLAMAPLLDAAAAANEGPEHEEVLYQRCLHHADFLDLQVALGRELTAACAELDVAHADGIASEVTDGRAASEGSASTCADGMHDALVELGDLPPFLELPAILHELAATSPSSAHGDAAPKGAWIGAWRRLQCFSASDLIHSEAWHDVPVALAALLRQANTAAAAVEPAGVSAGEAAAAEREVIELHAQLFDEGAAPQKVAALTALAAHARRARGDARLLCCHHLSRCRCALPAEALLLRAAEVQAAVGACVALATESVATDGNAAAAAADGEHGAGDSPPVAHLMAALDPSARWLALLLARGTWAAAAWAAAAPRLLEGCARACAAPLPAPPTRAPPPRGGRGGVPARGVGAERGGGSAPLRLLGAAAALPHRRRRRRCRGCRRRGSGRGGAHHRRGSRAARGGSPRVGAAHAAAAGAQGARACRAARRARCDALRAARGGARAECARRRARRARRGPPTCAVLRRASRA